MAKLTVLAMAAAALAVLLAVVAAPASASCDHKCGTQGENNGFALECGNNGCCSKDGECGIGAPYCGQGCQSGACYENLRCGVQANSTNPTLCPNNHCCSWDGFCGMGERYCGIDKVSGKGCQNGACIANITCSATQECPNNMCCAVDSSNGNTVGVCGLGPTYCRRCADGGSGPCAGDCVNGPCIAVTKCDAATPCTNKYCCGTPDGSTGSSCGLGKQYCCELNKCLSGPCTLSELIKLLFGTERRCV